MQTVSSKAPAKNRGKSSVKNNQSSNIEANASDSENLGRNALDIVVDVHCENEVSERKTKPKKRPEFRDSNSNVSMNVYTKKDQVRRINSQDSLDLIEEIKDSPDGSLTGFENGTMKGTKAKSWMQEDELISVEIARKRKRWKKEEMSANVADDPTKIRRKRWTKGKNFETETIENSESNNYIELKPVPAPRKSSEITETNLTKSIVEFDNEAFQPDSDDEVLTIETNYDKQCTKIEMSLSTINKINDESIRVKEYDEDLSLNEQISEEVQFERSNMGFEKRNNFMTDDNKENLNKKSRSKSVSDLEKTNRRKEQEVLSQDTTVSSISDDDGERLRKKRSRSKKIEKHRSKHRSKSAKESSRRSCSSSSAKMGKSRIKDKSKSKEVEEKKAKRKEKKKRKKVNLVKYISVTIHKCDMLELDYVTKHPMVKIHIINSSTGEYLKNNSKLNSEVSYLQPIITGTFSFKEHKSMTPAWEEEVIFEHDFQDLLREEPDSAIIIFEIVDLLTFNEARHYYDRYGSENCWHKIAWAFLKPLGVNDSLHINKKLRLQLYRPRKSSTNHGHFKCEAFEWWKSKTKIMYPSTLYVTVSAVEQPKLEPVCYDQLTFNDFSDFQSDSLMPHASKTSESEFIPTWSRSVDQVCKIPNELLFETEISENGCFYVSFSNNGKYLAYVASDENQFPIMVYKIGDGKIHVRFNGHTYFVYSLSWSHDDRLLLSLSSDQTARVWNVKEKIIQYIYLLPHPSYVYCGTFNNETSSIIVTGCYDKIVRIWTRNKRTKNYELMQELEFHRGFVNSLCFLKDDTLLTADSIGIIVSWTVKKSGKNFEKKEWQVFKEIKIKEINEIIINSIVPHPKENKLLIHSRKNSLILFNLSSGNVEQTYMGLENERIQISSCISPCGNLVLCGGEDSTLNIWNLESGERVAKYVIHDSCSIPITCVRYHFFEHMLAFSTFEAPSPVRVLKYDRHSNGRSVNLVLFCKDEESNVRPNTSYTDSSLGTLQAMSMSKGNSTLRMDAEESIFAGSTNNLLEDNESQISLVMKLQKFIETMPIPQFGNSNKMNSIIEKIDQILSNVSSARSVDDLESGRKLEHMSKLQSHDASIRENLEMKSSEKVKSKRKRSKSAKSVKNSCYSKKLEDMRSMLSEHLFLEKGSTNVLMNGEKLDLASNTLEKSDFEGITSLYLNTEGSSMSDDKVKCKLKSQRKRDDNLDSDDTYIVEKGDIEKNDDFGSSKDDSVESNVTFTIENEVPVPKPRKKYLEKQQA